MGRDSGGTRWACWLWRGRGVAGGGLRRRFGGGVRGVEAEKAEMLLVGLVVVAWILRMGRKRGMMVRVRD